MEADKTLRAKIINIVTFSLLTIGMIAYLFGWVNPSSLFCPDRSRLTLYSKNTDLVRNGTHLNHTISGFDCVDAHGVSVPNNADMIFGTVCVLPFGLLLVWGFVSSFLRSKKNQESPRRMKNHQQEKDTHAR